MNRKQLIRALAQHALAKKGAQQASDWCHCDPLEEPHVELPGSSWTEFLEVDQHDDEHFARLPVLAQRLKQLRRQYPAIRESEWMARDGHRYMDIPLDAGLPVEVFQALIDEAYAIVWNKLGAEDRLLIELAGLPYDEPKLLDRLAEIFHLKDRRKEIRKIARRAILLRTRKSSEAKIPLGATKVGGRPDLPPATAWPTYRDGRPLAFLAQINLGEIAKVGTPLRGLPKAGLLSAFSVWGWVEEDDLDPRTPSEDTDDQVGWTVMLHTPPRAKLERRRTPRGLRAFKAAAVEPTPILSLPDHRSEPALAALHWTEDEYDRFDDMQSAFRSLQMGHWLGNSDAVEGHHALGGYAVFQQYFPEEALATGRTMLLQIATDDHAEMCWGDGGELTFYADAKALARGRVERVWGTCQGG